MKKIQLTRKTIFLSLILIFAFGGGIFAYTRIKDNGKHNQAGEQKSDEADSSQNGINYGPPTEQEQKAGDAQKQKIAQKDQQSDKPVSEANVVISDAAQYGNQIEVRAFITNVIEKGTCMFTFKKDAETVQKQTAAFEDASTTQCTSLNIPRSEFSSSGTWELTVKYHSSSASGQTQRKIEVK